MDTNQKNGWRQTKNLIKMARPIVSIFAEARTSIFAEAPPALNKPIMNFKKRRIRSNLNRLKKAIEKKHATKQEIPTQPENLPAPGSFSTDSSKPAENPHRHHQTVKYVTIFVGLALVIGLFWITISLVKSLDFGSLIFSFGKDLKKDDAQMTNFLLVGVGGYGHDGSNLTDTMIIASLNPQTKSVKMLSIPRDLYVDDKQSGGQKINSVYDTYLNKYGSSPVALEKLATFITSITDIPIQYTIKIDFNGFVKIVDALGGITVNVENAIHDTAYPRGETIYYETFDISAGVHELDGETALKYARSRHTTSDFDRAKRQQEILSAIKEKALSIDLLTDGTKIQNLYTSIGDSIETNLSVAEIIELAKLAKDIGKNNIQSRVISDDFSSCGGLLYTPNRDYFGGAAVLLPAGNEYDELKSFAKNYFYKDIETGTPIQVLNATKTPNLALNYLNRFSRDCLNVIYYGNAANRDQLNSVIYYNPILIYPADPNSNQPPTKQIPPAVDLIKEIIDAPVVEGIPPAYLIDVKRAPTQVVLEIGQDFKSITKADPFNKLLYTAPTKTVEPTPSAEKPLNSASAPAPTISGISVTTATSSTGKTTPSAKTTPTP